MNSNTSQGANLSEKRILSIFEAIFSITIFYIHIHIEYFELGAVLFTLFLLYFLIKYIITFRLKSDDVYREHYEQGKAFSSAQKSHLIKLHLLFGFLLTAQIGFFIINEYQAIYIMNYFLCIGATSILLIKATFYDSFRLLSNKFDNWGAKVSKLENPPKIEHFMGFTLGALLLVSVRIFDISDLLVQLITVSLGLLLFIYALLSYFSQIKRVTPSIVDQLASSQFVKIALFIVSFFITVLTYGKLNEMTGLDGTSFLFTLTAVFVASIILSLSIVAFGLAGLGIIFSPVPLESSEEKSATLKEKIIWLRLTIFPFFQDEGELKEKAKVRAFLILNYLFTFGVIGAVFVNYTKNPLEKFEYFVTKSAYEFDLNSSVYCGEIENFCKVQLKPHKFAYIDAAKTKFIAYDQTLNPILSGKCLNTFEGEVSEVRSNSRVIEGENNKENWEKCSILLDKGISAKKTAFAAYKKSN